jgi:hypothetical protein
MVNIIFQLLSKPLLIVNGGITLLISGTVFLFSCLDNQIIVLTFIVESDSTPFSVSLLMVPPLLHL